jgi:hypothetical protein
MRSGRISFLLLWLGVATCLMPSRTIAQEPFGAGHAGDIEILNSLQERLDKLEQENQAIQRENARLLGALEESKNEPLKATAPASSNHTPGAGLTISMFNKTSQLNIGATLSALSTFSTSRPFSASLPLFLYPESPTGRATNTFDLHARQSAINARFTGAEVTLMMRGETVTACLPPRFWL